MVTTRVPGPEAVVVRDDGYSPDFVSRVPSGIVTARFDDTTVFLTNVRGACEGPAEASYEIHLLENGTLDVILIDDPCLFRASFFPGEWAPVF
jgi:hypothetical protein